MAVGTGFGQLFRGIGMCLLRINLLSVHVPFLIGQVGGVAISAALFQSTLSTELHKRIRGPDAEEV